MRCILFIFFFAFSMSPLLAQILPPDESLPVSIVLDSIKPLNTKLIGLPSKNVDLSIDHAEGTIQKNSTIPALFSLESWSDFQNRIEITGSKYFVDFTAGWCAPCKVMDLQVFTDSRVIEVTNKSYLAKQIDIDDFDGIAIAQKYRIVSLPTILIFDCSGQFLHRIEGLQYADMLLNQLLTHR